MEFDLIHRHFKMPFGALARAGQGTVRHGIGDDCAALTLQPDHTLYVSTDTLVEGVHFFSDDAAFSTGWKSLACNLSDLAACGAQPFAFTLNLTLPAVDENWLAGYSAGLLELATRHACALVGGDTSSAGQSHIKTLAITVFGQAPAAHRGFHRSHAQVEDDIWVSGTPGLARLGLLLEADKRNQLENHCAQSQLHPIRALLAQLPAQLATAAVQRFQQPEPQINLGMQLRDFAHACIDLSDGLSGDLGHISQASGVAAFLSVRHIHGIWFKLWPELVSHPNKAELLDTLQSLTLQGGDDYELCWTSPQQHRDSLLTNHGDSIHLLGVLKTGNGVWVQGEGSVATPAGSGSYSHFSGAGA